MFSLLKLIGLALILACGALVLAGCGSAGRPTATIHGVVTFKGRPVSAGYVVFIPENNAPEVRSPLGPDGSYRATGVTVGRCTVAVETQAFQHLMPPPRGLAKGISSDRPVYTPIPAKYERPQTSQLTYEVKSGSNTYDVNLY